MNMNQEYPPFTGFTEETLEFFWGLKLNNEKPWFEAHREQYQRTVLTPFKSLAWETAALIQQRFPEQLLQLHISRIYRDARRLFGRGPYKDNIWFSLKKEAGLLCGPMFWFEVGAVSFSYGMGFYSATPEQMESWRRRIEENPGPLSRIAEQINAQDAFVLDGTEYKRPKGDVGPLLNPWYNKKQIGLCCENGFKGVILTPELPKILTDGYAFLMPCYEYLCQFCRENILWEEK